MLVGFGNEFIPSQLLQPDFYAVFNNFGQLANRYVIIRRKEFDVYFLPLNLEKNAVGECFQQEITYGIACVGKVTAESLYYLVIPQISVMRVILCIIFLGSCHILNF